MNFYLGLVVGFVLSGLLYGLLALKYFKSLDVKPGQNAETASAQSGLNEAEKEEFKRRQERMKELDRQFSRMMDYNGKPQKRGRA